LFSNTYGEARETFLKMASARHARVVSVVHPDERGALDEELAIDFAIFGDHAAEKTLLLVSGTHGQEGFTGSALQVAFLRDLEVPRGVNVIAIHGLNPWGFSHLSRTNESNIDLNRNFGDYDAPLPQNDLYRALHGALCPDDWNEETIDWTSTRDDVIRNHGLKPFMTAVTGGQFIEPTGLNFGGLGPSWSRSTVERHLPPMLKNARKVAFIEWHTGLGAFGELCHICLSTPGSAPYERVFEWMGDEARASFAASMDLSKGETADYNGPFCTWLPTTAPHAEWAGLVIEVGTYGNMQLADALRMDRWLKFGRGRSSVAREEMRRTMMERLFPSAPEWRAAALKNGLDAQQRALQGLQRW
jgi:hypothetical protein